MTQTYFVPEGEVRVILVSPLFFVSMETATKTCSSRSIDEVLFPAQPCDIIESATEPLTSIVLTREKH